MKGAGIDIAMDFDAWLVCEEWSHGVSYVLSYPPAIFIVMITEYMKKDHFFINNADFSVGSIGKARYKHVDSMSRIAKRTILSSSYLIEGSCKPTVGTPLLS